ncbi:MAG: hypothetical protein WCG47_24425 [Dermatophilaceae bacterium]
MIGDVSAGLLRLAVLRSVRERLDFGSVLGEVHQEGTYLWRRGFEGWLVSARERQAPTGSGEE